MLAFKEYCKSGDVDFQQINTARRELEKFIMNKPNVRKPSCSQ